ncbi:LarC family nickel insertion protein [Paenibacillus sp. y28]|uniref:LarC family nickel insertion protein n=1 Tax=Paenibacillus sp. y28 TaxID=3129110 RepID=UPI0030193303
MRILYLDCFSGLSGDMTVAALVDAGADRRYIEAELKRIEIEPFHLEWSTANKRGISALKLDVLTDPAFPPNRHRHYSEIVRLIQQAGFNERVTRWSLAIFERIGIAEGKIHGIPVERVHFHEVGAIDSIADVIGVALALDSLGIERIYCAPVPLGAGTVKCDHGLYPVPAPATLEMMKGLPIRPSSYAVEMTTPTGAGIASGIVDEFCPGLPPMYVEAIGYGAGTRDLPLQPNVLRAVVGTLDESAPPWAGKYAPYTRTPSSGHEHSHGHAHVNSGHEHSHEHSHHHDHGHSHSHEHSHELDHGHSHSHEHSHEHDHGHSHSHEHSHHHDHGHSHSHEHSHELDHGHSHSHEHSHEHDHGHSHSHEHSHHHDHGHSHSHEHSHEHDHGHSHSHEHSHEHDHGHAHSHEHSHEHDHERSHSHDQSAEQQKQAEK